MYKLIKNNVVFATTDSLVFVKISGKGTLVSTIEDDATGVSYRSRLYNIFGTDGIGSSETISAILVDAGKEIEERQIISEAACDYIGLDARICKLELGIK